jgi:predicted transport protein
LKIFQSDEGSINELKDVSFDYERAIQKLLESNLGNIFPGLEFVKSEYYIEEFIADTIAFDNETTSFVIIEYKNVKSKSVIDQGITYYNLLQENRPAFVLLYQKEKGKLYDVKNVKWDETRVIFVSPSFTPYQKRASGYSGVPIELYEIRSFDRGIITLERIEGKASSVNAPSKKIHVKPRLEAVEYSEEEYLDGKYDGITRSIETKNLYQKLRVGLLDRFELDVKQKKQYTGFYSKKDGSSICTVEVQKRKMILTYSTRDAGLVSDSGFVRDVSNVGHWGNGYFQSDIKSESDISRALPLIEKVFRSK